MIFTDETPHSSGNHAGALALAARDRGVECFVVMVGGVYPKLQPFQRLAKID